MINFLLTISLLFAQENYICTFKETGDLPKIRFRGETREIAMERVVRLCIGIRTQQYFTLRNQAPSTERLIVFLEDCVNKTYCLDNR